MTSDQVIKYEKRGFLKILWHYIYLKHELVSTFIFPSILIPFHIRITSFFLIINLKWCLNAMLFTDDLIQLRNLEKDILLIRVIYFLFYLYIFLFLYLSKIKKIFIFFL